MDEKTKLMRFILFGLLVISADVGWHVYEYLIKGKGECHHETPFVRDIVELSRNLYDLEAQTGVKLLDNVDYQGRTTLHSRDDQAQFPLFQRIDDSFSLNESTTIYLLERLYDNYALDSNFREKFSAGKKQEELEFLLAILKTPIMRRAMEFLHSKAAVDADDDNAQLRLLQNIWFTQYSRGGREVGSSGFEHVFLAELKAGSVLGLHNWIYFREQERQGNLDYKGFITLVELNKKRQQHVAAVRFRFHNIIKPYNTIFVGTSPELEMSLYTVCFVLNSDRPCLVELGHSELTIITRSWKWMGKQVIAAAYPSIYLGYGRHKEIRVKTRLDAPNLVDVLRDDPPTEETAKIEFLKKDKRAKDFGYVDDLLIAGRSFNSINRLKKLLSETFDTSDCGQLKHMGIKIATEDGCIKLPQGASLERILLKIGLSECNPVKSLMEKGLQLLQNIVKH